MITYLLMILATCFIVYEMLEQEAVMREFFVNTVSTKIQLN